MYSNSYDLFRQFDANVLVANYTVCPPNWGEIDCKYDYHKFYYFQGGDGTIQIKQDIFRPKKGELFLIPAGVRHTYSHNPEQPVIKYWCHFSITSSDLWHIIYHPKALFCTPDADIVIPLFDQLISAYHSSSPLSALLQKAALSGICHEFFSHVDLSLLIHQADDSFQVTVNNYILSHLTDKIRLQDLADITHMQKNYFISKFKKEFGTTPIDYINTLRLEAYIKDITVHPSTSITKLSLCYGFDDYRYFGRLFKQRYGISPSAFRDNYIR